MPSLNGETEIERKRRAERAALPKLNLNSLQSHKEAKWRLCATRSSTFNCLFLKVSPRLLTLLVLAAAAEEAGLMAGLAAEAIWLSSTSKVGQLVPVAPLMCWRGAHGGGSRARLKGLRSSSREDEEEKEEVGGEEAAEVGGSGPQGPCESCTSLADPERRRTLD